MLSPRHLLAPCWCRPAAPATPSASRRSWRSAETWLWRRGWCLTQCIPVRPGLGRENSPPAGSLCGTVPAARCAGFSQPSQQAAPTYCHVLSNSLASSGAACVVRDGAGADQGCPHVSRRQGGARAAAGDAGGASGVGGTQGAVPAHRRAWGRVAALGMRARGSGTHLPCCGQQQGALQ